MMSAFALPRIISTASIIGAHRPVVRAGVYLCEVIVAVYQLFDDVEVVCVGHILHGHVQP